MLFRPDLAQQSDALLTPYPLVRARCNPLIQNGFGGRAERGPSASVNTRTTSTSVTRCPKGWLGESFTMWGVAALVVAVTVTAVDTQVSAIVYRVASGLLLALAALTAFTGARTPIIWFEVCPVLLVTSAALLLASAL
jgi:hypothetical protein